jgi:uncharacterized membrane protein YdbT with pleckstrin-like domain
VGYPKGLLSEGESVVAHKHPHFKMLILPIIIGVVTIAGGIWLAVLAQTASPPWDLVSWIAIGVVGGIILVWLVLTPFARWRTTHFVVTTERVKVREGVIKRTGVDIPMARINSVRFEHSLIDRIFGCGTLIIESASEQALQFDDIPGVEKIHSRIYHQLGALGRDADSGDSDDDFDEPGNPRTRPERRPRT